MKNMYQYPLDFLSAMQYVQEVLDKSNALGSNLLQFVDFSKGIFFSYLPDCVDCKDIRNYSSGGISSNNYKETADFILKLIQENDKLSLLINDIIRVPEDRYIKKIGAPVVVHEREVYYLIENQLANPEIILQCLQETDAIWHSVSVLAEDIQFKEYIASEAFEQIAHKTQTIIIGAYDGEGYIFWRKTISN